MFRNVFLHHFISLILFGLYQSSTTYLVKYLPVPVEEGVHIVGLVSIIILYLVIPVVLYTYGKILLLPELKLKGTFKKLLKQNFMVITCLYAAFFVWYLVGDALHDPTNGFMVAVWLLYGVLLLAIISVGITYLQILHAQGTWKKANRAFAKHWTYAFYWLGLTLAAAVVWTYLPILPPSVLEGIIFVTLALYVAGYTKWQLSLLSAL